MINSWFNENHIYSPKTRTYFKEVISLYSNENFRSAIVMLYSTVIYDLIIKLQELRDTDGDKKAEKILSQIETKRIQKSEDGIQYDSSWERDIVDMIAKETNLFDSHMKIKLDHLHDIRNLCSHPALSSGYELYLPSKEETVAFIKEFYQEVFIKPPFYIGSVFDKLTDDLVLQKENFNDDYDKLKFYLEKRYFNRMPDKMILQIFKKLWQFIFMKDEDSKCIENRDINLKCIKILFYLKRDLLLNEIKQNVLYNKISLNNEKCELLIDLFISIPNLYEQFLPILQDPFNSMLPKLKGRTNVLSWFLFGDFDSFYTWLLENEKDNVKNLLESVREKLYAYFIDNGRLEQWIDYSILHFSKSVSYNDADNRFNMFISPILENISKCQLDKIMEGINNNSQLYNRWRAYSDNTKIVSIVSKRFDLDDTYFSSYSNFSYRKIEGSNS